MAANARPGRLMTVWKYRTEWGERGKVDSVFLRTRVHSPEGSPPMVQLGQDLPRRHGDTEKS